MPVHFLRNLPHLRLIIAVVLGAVTTLFLPTHLRGVTIILIGWNTSIWIYLILITWLMLHADQTKVIQVATQEHERGVVILMMLSIVAIASLAAIVLELSTIKELTQLKSLYYLLTFSTIFGSWCFVGTMFTMQYAHMFYRTAEHQRPLNFPNEPGPDYWDFLYFSFTIAVAAQTSDVTVTNKKMRKVVLFQSILSFIFNVAIIGLSINIAAGFIG